MISCLIVSLNQTSESSEAWTQGSGVR
uniref:Uncharacterized protein n=1 Tax=Anguilla anguilla TaxID=7936 RepID=A0A0E9Q4I0_ANGAN